MRNSVVRNSHDAMNKSNRNQVLFSRKKGGQKENVNEPNLLENNNYIIGMFKETMEKEKIEFVKKMEAEVNELTYQVVNAMENNKFTWHEGTDKVKEKHFRKTSRLGFHEKVFQPRNSLLTDLFKVKHISTIYHIFVAFLIYLLINTAINDFLEFGNIILGFELIRWNFQSLSVALLIWLVMQAATIAIYFLFKVWAKRRNYFIKPLSVRLWDLTFLAIILFYKVLFLVIPAHVVMRQRLTISVSLAVLMEQVRFLMKTYSFVRLNAARVARSTESRKSPSKPFFPTFKMYMYFLFAPTLVYRDEYPRTSQVRWNIVIRHCLEIIGGVFYLAFIMEHHLIPPVKNFGKTRVTPQEVIFVLFNNSLPCVFIFLCGFYFFLHAWMNAFAEMLRFADRMFYQDWWNSSSFAEYYKTWNVIVHDWLYEFIYKDGTENLTKKKSASTWMVFIVSAFFHEYILAFTFKFCYPVLFMIFGIFGTCLMFAPKKRSSPAGNMFLWLGIFSGTGCCGSLYMLEYYARINCPPSSESPFIDFFVPRSWTCEFDRSQQQ